MAGKSNNVINSHANKCSKNKLSVIDAYFIFSWVYVFAMTLTILAVCIR